jgi:serine/threonine protein kinase
MRDEGGKYSRTKPWIFSDHFQYHDRGPSEHDPPDREVNLFLCESTAYERLKAKGLCERGVVPDFYGTITNIQPALWPSLHMFLGDKLPPNAVLIEYVPNIQPIDLSNFSLQYLREFGHVLEEIHRAGILHGDPKPRNMVVSWDQGRVLWIDFDSAQTFSESLSTRQRTWIKEEDEMMEYFVEALVCLHRLCATLIDSVPGARLRGR